MVETCIDKLDKEIRKEISKCRCDGSGMVNMEDFERIYSMMRHRRWLSEHRINIRISKDDFEFIVWALLRFSYITRRKDIELYRRIDTMRHELDHMGRTKKPHFNLWFYEEQCVELMELLILYQNCSKVDWDIAYLKAALASQGLHDHSLDRDCKKRAEVFNNILGIAYINWQNEMKAKEK